MYYDVYDLTSLLRQGENVVGVLLGNGFQNDFGGAAWDFDRAAWRSAPKLALEFRADGSGQVLEFCADEQFRTHPSPIRFDEYRLGEIYDAAAELPGWNLPGADASGWEQHSYTALCSAADCAAIRMLKTYPNLKTVYLCLDHDSAGIEGAYRVAESIHALGDYTVWRKMPKNKDWDEDLKALHGRTAIPSTEHTKLERYRKICAEFLTDACMETDAWKHIAEAKGYASANFLSLLRSEMDKAESATDTQTEQAHLRAMAVGCLAFCFCREKQTGNASSFDRYTEAVRSAYKPHRDTESSDEQWESLLKRVKGLEKEFGKSTPLSETEMKKQLDSVIALASECIRLSAAVEYEQSEQAAVLSLE